MIIQENMISILVSISGKNILACLPFASQKKLTNSVHFKDRMLDN